MTAHWRHHGNNWLTRTNDMTGLGMLFDAIRISTFWALNMKARLHCQQIWSIVYSSKKVALLIVQRIIFMSWVFVSISYVFGLADNTKYLTTIDFFLLFSTFVFVFLLDFRCNNGNRSMWNKNTNYESTCAYNITNPLYVFNNQSISMHHGIWISIQRKYGHAIGHRNCILVIQ